MGDSFDISDNRRTVLALKAGDEKAFKAVYMAWCAPLRRYADSILHNETDAREIVQELFVALWMNRRRLDETKSLRNYLLRAVHNNALRECQRRDVRHRQAELLKTELPPESFTSNPEEEHTPRPKRSSCRPSPDSRAKAAASWR